MKYLLAIALLINSYSSKAQKNNGIKNINIYPLISNCIQNNYHPDSIALSRLCRRACVFIKFSVNAQGKITNLTYSKDSIIFIKEALTKAVYSIEKNDTLIKTLRKSGKIIIQPFQYYYQAGCNFPKTTDTSILNDKTQNPKSYYEIRDEMEFFGATIFDMMNFDNGKLMAVDCVLLAPIRVGAGSME